MVMGTAKAMVAALPATTVTATTTYNNQLNGGPPAVDCYDDDNDDNPSDSNRDGNGKGDGDGKGNGGDTHCNNNYSNHNIQKSTKWGSAGGRLQ